MDLLSTPLPASSPPPEEDDIPWTALKRIGFYGGILLATVIVVTSILQYVSPLLRGH
jgi:hypothetical protein